MGVPDSRCMACTSHAATPHMHARRPASPVVQPEAQGEPSETNGDAAETPAQEEGACQM